MFTALILLNLSPKQPCAGGTASLIHDLSDGLPLKYLLVDLHTHTLLVFSAADAGPSFVIYHHETLHRLCNSLDNIIHY